MVDDKRRPQRDRVALVAVLALFGRLVNVVKWYLETGTEGPRASEIGDVDVEAAELLAEIEGR
jgi:hypothetical protein